MARRLTGPGTRRADERRREKRHPLEVTLELRVGREMLFSATANLSKKGAYLDRAIPKPVGTAVKVRILLPDGGAPIDCDGRVANIPDKAKMGMGLEFTSMAEPDQRRIEALADLKGEVN